MLTLHVSFLWLENIVCNCSTIMHYYRFPFTFKRGTVESPNFRIRHRLDVTTFPPQQDRKVPNNKYRSGSNYLVKEIAIQHCLILYRFFPSPGNKFSFGQNISAHIKHDTYGSLSMGHMSKISRLNFESLY